MRLRVPDALMPVAMASSLDVEASAVSHGEEGSVVRVQAQERGPQVHGRDTGGWVDAAGFLPCLWRPRSWRGDGACGEAACASLAATETSQGRSWSGPWTRSSFFHATSQAACTASSAMAWSPLIARQTRRMSSWWSAMMRRKASSSPAAADASTSPPVPVCHPRHCLHTSHYGLGSADCLRPSRLHGCEPRALMSWRRRTEAARSERAGRDSLGLEREVPEPQGCDDGPEDPRQIGELVRRDRPRLREVVDLLM